MHFVLMDEQHRRSRNHKRQPPICTECVEDDHSRHPLFDEGACVNRSCRCAWRPAAFTWGPLLSVYCGCAFRAIRADHHMAQYCSHRHRGSLELRHAWRPLTLPHPVLATFLDIRGAGARCSILTRRIAPPPSHVNDVLLYIGLVTNQFIRAGVGVPAFRDTSPAEAIFLDKGGWHTEDDAN